MRIEGSDGEITIRMGYEEAKNSGVDHGEGFIYVYVDDTLEAINALSRALRQARTHEKEEEWEPNRSSQG